MRDDAQMDETGEAFGAEEYEPALKLAQDRICREVMVSAVAHEGEFPPPYVAHVYLRDGVAVIWAGTIWRHDRWPTVDEISDALVRWRSQGGEASPVFHVEWWKDDANDQA